MNKTIVKYALSIAITFSLFFPALSLADAGKAIFVYGKAFTVSPDGDRKALVKGSSVDSGDTVITSSNGRVQLQMADGGLLALRPGTEFVIEQFRMPASASNTATAFAEETEPRSFFALVKGGFRSITGAIGKENKANYRVKTPVATIGIRGTDYDAVYCAADCMAYSKVVGKDLKDGLYIAVNDGGVSMTTDAGALDLDAGEAGYVKDAGAVPSRSADAAAMMAASSETSGDEEASADDEAVAGTPDTGLDASDAAGNPANLLDGEAEAAPALGAVAFSAYPGKSDAGVSGAATANAVRDAAGNVVGFNDGTDSVSLDGGNVVNVGRDDDRAGATGLNWGRWSDGNVAVTSGDSATSAPVDGSVHYVAGADGSASPMVPTTGTAQFELIGNTDPTDNRGNTGTLGSADLSADFTSQTVDADVNLSFAETNEVWNASAQDVDINSADATFAGEFDDVTVTGDNGTATGSGDLGGFFSGNDSGEITGAGMTYTLNEGSTEVNGSAAFQTAPDGN
ncbi:MAG: hypothetical protein HKN70_13490 [Gammaproteobacteria bacterium]|nr:hypothetical protein [Gammaproteobacteria bacterium]